MRDAFGRLFAAGYSTVVMIGSISRRCPTSYVAQHSKDVRDRPDALVIGPATDGGYYLIGLRRPVPRCHVDGIEYGDVLATTTSIAETCGLTVSFVPPWHDVDTVDDLRRVLRDPHGATHTRAWATAHGDLAVREAHGDRASTAPVSLTVGAVYASRALHRPKRAPWPLRTEGQRKAVCECHVAGVGYAGRQS